MQFKNLATWCKDDNGKRLDITTGKKFLGAFIEAAPAANLP